MSRYIHAKWWVMVVVPGAAFILSNAVSFITTQGRMKFVRPLYRELYKSKMAKELAIETYKKNQVCLVCLSLPHHMALIYALRG